MTGIILYTLAILLLIISFFKDRKKTICAIKSTLKSIENILPQFLGIIVIVGLLVSILNPETISNIIGKNSGFLGIILASIIGSITMVPTFVAFSIGDTLLKNGAGYSQITALLSTLILVGIVTFPLEVQYMGKKATILRSVIAFLFSIILALIVGKVMIIL